MQGTCRTPRVLERLQRYIPQQNKPIISVEANHICRSQSGHCAPSDWPSGRCASLSSPPGWRLSVCSSTSPSTARPKEASWSSWSMARHRLSCRQRLFEDGETQTKKCLNDKRMTLAERDNLEMFHLCSYLRLCPWLFSVCCCYCLLSWSWLLAWLLALSSLVVSF